MHQTVLLDAYESNLLFEGWKDKKLFEIAMSGKSSSATSLKKTANQLGYCHAQGVKDIPKLSAMLEMANRSWVVISDGDKIAKEWQKKHSWEAKWVRYDQIKGCSKIETMEDFVSEKKCQSTLQKVCKEMAIPIDSDFSIPEFSKLAAIKKALNLAGNDAPTIKSALDAFKDKLLGTLKSNDIKTIYFDGMLEVIVETTNEDTSAIHND